MRLLFAESDIVSSENVPGNITTKYSRVNRKEMRSGEMLTVKIVYDKNHGRDKQTGIKNVPILTPLGLPLIGLKEGDMHEDRIYIQSILYQPESEWKAVPKLYARIPELTLSGIEKIINIP